MEDSDVVALPEELSDDFRADESSSAQDKNVHGTLSVGRREHSDLSTCRYIISPFTLYGGK